MSNEEHLAILRKAVADWNDWRKQKPKVKPTPGLTSVDAWNQWRRQNPNIKPDLSGADLSGVDLTLANLSETNLSQARLSRAELFMTNLSGADLASADLSEARLMGADLTRAQLRGAKLGWTRLNETKLVRAELMSVYLGEADLRGANLSEARLSEADLRGANLDGANLHETILRASLMGDTIIGDVDLSATKGLETVLHEGPSTIGIDTIYRSKGRIPEIFLRGAEVPEPFIVQMKVLVTTMEPIQFYSCFISYSSKDQEFVERLHSDLRKKNVRCWFAPKDMKIGDPIRDRIEQAVRIHDKLLLVLSENSIQSAWVEDEVEAAFEKERLQKHTVLFPIRLDDAVMASPKGWAAMVRRIVHMGDFRGWKDPDEYNAQLERLMRDLKTDDERKDKPLD